MTVCFTPGGMCTDLIVTALNAAKTSILVQAYRFASAAIAIAHNKVMVIDRETVITGSFHFTKAAQEKNTENVLIIRDAALATQYTQNWHVDAQYSQPYVRPGVAR